MNEPLSLIIESMLFASEKPLSPKDIHSWLPEYSLADIRQAIIELTESYDSLERSFALKEVAQGYQLRTRASFAQYILRMMKTSTTRLSRAAMETLAIIAYKQPILRHEIERLRGVDVGGILKTLMEKNLVKIMGRKSLPGRPLIYGTTKKFLEVFDLKDLDSLPKIKEIKDFGPNEEQEEIVQQAGRQFGIPEENEEKGTQTPDEHDHDREAKDTSHPRSHAPDSFNEESD